MTFLLYRYILRDLLRALLLTTGILVTVTAFGAAIEPLASEELVAADQVLKYIGLASVPMLQFALPFSAGFAATIVLHRMTADNEIQAMAVSGVSYRRVLLPVAALGLILLVIMIALTQWIIPRFWGVIKGTITSDVTRLFQATIKQGEAFEVGNLQIYADDLIVQHNPEGTDVDTRMILVRGAASELFPDGRVAVDVTFSQAVADLYERDGRTFLKLAMMDTVVYNANTGQLARMEELRPDRAILVPSALEDDPISMTQPELIALRADPDTFSEVVEERSTLVARMREASVSDIIDQELRTNGQIELMQQGPDQRSYTVIADRLSRGGFVRRVGSVEVIETVGGRQTPGQTRRFLAGDAVLSRAESNRLDLPTRDLELSDCRVIDDSVGGAVNQRARIAIASLVVPPPKDDDLATLDSVSLIERAAEYEGQRQVTQAVKRLEKVVRSTRQEALSRLHKRYALSLTAPLLLILGATLAIWMRRSLPLTVYVWAFLPSVLNLILISGGEQTFQDAKVSGAVMLWSGNAVMITIFAFAYWRLSRH